MKRGIRSSRFFSAASSSAARRTRVSESIWFPAFTGKELYLYGSYSGRTSIHCDFSNAGRNERADTMLVSTANGEMPIAGETRKSRPGRGSESSEAARTA